MDEFAIMSSKVEQHAYFKKRKATEAAEIKQWESETLRVKDFVASSHPELGHSAVFRQYEGVQLEKQAEKRRRLSQRVKEAEEQATEEDLLEQPRSKPSSGEWGSFEEKHGLFSSPILFKAFQEVLAERSKPVDDRMED